MPSNYQVTSKNVIATNGIMVAVRTEQTLITESATVINGHEEKEATRQQIEDLQNKYNQIGGEWYFGHLDQINLSINFYNQLP